MKSYVFSIFLVTQLSLFAQVGMMGSFNNWTTDIVMLTTDNVNWTLSHTFNTSATVKFRLDGSWTVNWGSSAFPGGTGTQNGPDIPVSAGVYDITFNSTTGVYFFDLVQPIIEPYLNPSNRQVMLQGFWWDYYNANYNNGWCNYLTELAPRLKELGIDAIWIPPTIKNTGTNSVGYAPFDHYDLGDKWQKNNVKTRMGDKDELLRMMAVYKSNGIRVVQDVVLNHITGAGSSSGAGGTDPDAMDDGQTQRFKNFRYSCFGTPAVNQSSATYLSLQGRFPKNWQNFYPNPGNPCCSNDINSPFWGPDISYESNAFGQSSNATFNPTQTANYMRNGTRDWMIWYKKQMGWDGLRIDAVKHFPNYIVEDYLWNLQNNASWASGGQELFAVGELVDFNGGNLDNWCNSVENRAGTFDFALRDGLHGIISGNGFYNLGNIPGTQQNNRGRTVPFVNNHDSFRPNFDSNGNYISWGNALAPLIEPNDTRLSVVYAIMMSVDGAPQVFFEDLFDIGYNSNRFNHDPKNAAQLPMRSDIANIIWCHQNLHFKSGAYFVRWQAQDALVIERGGKALIAVTDSYSDWQNLTGVQTTFPDGTVLKDFSEANPATTTVYGGGLVNISIPPCDGSAPMGRKGYSIWAPESMTDNYVQPAQRITQEWEMANDLGDRHNNSLQQGGALPNNSLDCRSVGKIFVKADEEILIDVFPENASLGITLFLQDADCAELTSGTNTGAFSFTYTPTYTGWLNIKVKNATETQAGQRCWVKVNYMAPPVVNTTVPKLKCACTFSDVSVEENITSFNLSVYPNPTKEELYINNVQNSQNISAYQIWSVDGRMAGEGKFNDPNQLKVNTSDLQPGVYLLHVTLGTTEEKMIIRFVKN